LARDALTLAPDPGLQTTWLAIQHLAAVAALQGRCRTAARLTGVVDGWCDRYGYQRIGFERATYEILTKSLRVQLSTEALHALTTEGARLDFEQAVDEALSLS
jgi:hypothetical protein